MRQVLIENRTRPLEAPLKAGYCQSYLCKLRGLAFRRILPPDEGLLLVSRRDSRMDAAIHMFGMGFDLAVIWINDAGQVVDRRLARRWLTISVPRRPARYVLEIGPGRLNEFQIGDEVGFEEILDT